MARLPSAFIPGDSNSPINNLQTIIERTTNPTQKSYGEQRVLPALKAAEAKIKSENGNPQSLSQKLVLCSYQAIARYLLDEMVNLEQRQNEQNKREKIKLLQKLLDAHLARCPTFSDDSVEYARLHSELTQRYRERNQVLNVKFRSQIELLFKAVNDAKANNVPNYLLITSIQLSLEAIDSRTASDSLKTGKRLCLLAENLPGKSSLAYQRLGGALMVLGIIIMTVGVLIAITTLIPSFGLGFFGGIGIAASGFALFGFGGGLFYQGRRKDLSQATHQLAEKVVSTAGR